MRSGRVSRPGQHDGDNLRQPALTRELSVFDVRQPRGELPIHSHAHARIALTLEGSVTEHSQGRVDSFRKGDVVFWREGATHKDVFVRPTRSLQVELSHETYRHVAAYFPPPPSPIPSDRFEGAAQRLLREMEGFDDASPMALQAVVYEILARATRLVTGDQPVSFAVNQAIRFADQHFADPITLTELAGAANVSVRRLHERFTAELRMTPMDYLRELRLTRAEALLRETTRSSSDIAGACGFYDHAHFCRLFKRRTGLPPGEFRRKQ
jgi:AraC-like DNA-binding protein